MRIAAAQTLVSPDVAANGATLRATITAAAAEGCRLIVFCEGALSGYAKAQIAHPDAWAGFDWAGQEAELRAIAALCGRLGIVAVVGGAHRLTGPHPPHNSLYVLSGRGELMTRYDKRLLSHSELSGWYTPGVEPVVFDVDGFRFGCAVCIESQFPEAFRDYEQMGVDAVLFASWGIPSYFQVALQAHAGLNCLWVGAATPAQAAGKGPAGIVGPDGTWAARCAPTAATAFVATTLDRDDPRYDIALKKARPWRRSARQGDIYRARRVDDPRSANRGSY